MKLSIVTPSYNQGRFIRATIESVLSQNYPDLEYLIMDGGSTDSTVDVLKSYGNAITWVSEKDGGQADAVNKGILRATGEIIGWLNSDDVYYPGAFDAVMKIFKDHPDVNVVYGHADHINIDGSFREEYYTEHWDYERLKDICFICQPAVFFRRKTVMKYGLLDADRQYAMDYDLWLRMGKGETFYFLNRKVAGSRLYEENKTLGSVEKVHIDIMDTLQKNIGYVPKRWIEGSAHSVSKAHGFSVESPLRYREYKGEVLSLIKSYVEKYGHNPTDSLSGYPYLYQTLKIGIDISSTLLKDGSGVPQYTGAVVSEMLRIDTQNQFLLYPLFADCYPIDRISYGIRSEQKNVTRFFDGIIPSDCSVVGQAFTSGNPEKLMELLDYPDVVFCPAFHFSRELAKMTATVVTIHDVSFLENPEFSTKANHDLCFRGMYDAALFADLFVAISQHSKESFLKYFPFVNADRIIVTPLGCRECFAQNVDMEKELNSLSVSPTEPFWLFTGTVEPRKNLVSLIRAYAELGKRQETFPLYIAGGRGWLDSEIYQEVKKLGIEEKVRFLGYVTDEQLTALYRACYAFVYPSWYEGFGLPILEAMTSGAAVISSNTSAMPEVGKDGVLYVNPASLSEITDAMARLQNDISFRNQLAQKGHEIALRDFSWKKCAEDTYRVLYAAIARHAQQSKNS